MKILWGNTFGAGLKCTVLLFTFLATVVLSNNTFAQDTSGARLEAAERYAKVFNLPKIMNETVAQMALSVPESKRQDFINFMSKTLDIQMLEGLLVDTMTEHFTTNELNALADFYGSPEGLSIVEKMPVYMASTMPKIQAVVLKTAQKF